MSELQTVSETLYVPLLGRMYASEHYPEILYDTAALSLSDRLPERIITMSGQNEYTYLASAVRSKNIDYDLTIFLNENPDGVIVNVGCGLETLYQRNDNGHALWFELDLPEVLELRGAIFPKRRGTFICRTPCSIMHGQTPCRRFLKDRLWLLLPDCFIIFKKIR